MWKVRDYYEVEAGCYSDVVYYTEKAELNPIIATRPLELVHIDYLTVEAPANSKSDKDINVLVITITLPDMHKHM